LIENLKKVLDEIKEEILNQWFCLFNCQKLAFINIKIKSCPLSFNWWPLESHGLFGSSLGAVLPSSSRSISLLFVVSTQIWWVLSSLQWSETTWIGKRLHALPMLSHSISAYFDKCQDPGSILTFSRLLI
jgi:hypothetical protein